jgi:hypothetical protein
MADTDDRDIIQVKFEKETLSKLYQTGASREISPERWERVREGIRFEDVVADLTGHSGSDFICCPFHGPELIASFKLYRGSNDGWCFGCPPKSQFYDNVRFVSRYLDITRPAALRWLEKKWDLPELFVSEEEGDEEEGASIQLKFKDLQEPYILKAVKQVREFKDVELAEDYLLCYFKAVQQLKMSKEAKKEGEIEDAVDFEIKAATTLARVLTKKEIDRIFAHKQARS